MASLSGRLWRTRLARRQGGRGGRGFLALIVVIMALTLNVPGVIFAPITLPLVFLLAVIAVFCIASVILIPIVFGLY
jgi:hypothetical protein